MTATTNSPRFVGWYRPDKRSPWRAVVEGDTEDDVFSKLLDAVAGGDKVILPSGQDPNIKPLRPMHRRL